MVSRFRTIRCFFPTAQSARLAGFAVAAVLAASLAAHVQVAPASSDSPAATQPAQATQPSQTVPPVTLSNVPATKTRKQDKVIESKDTKKENKKLRMNPLRLVKKSYLFCLLFLFYIICVMLQIQVFMQILCILFVLFGLLLLFLILNTVLMLFLSCYY